MKLNSAIVISFIVLILGVFLSKSYLWIPSSVLAAGVIDLLTRKWVVSDKIGLWIKTSVLLKFSLALIGFYGMVGQAVCVGLVVWWLV